MGAFDLVTDAGVIESDFILVVGGGWDLCVVPVKDAEGVEGWDRDFGANVGKPSGGERGEEGDSVGEENVKDEDDAEVCMAEVSAPEEVRSCMIGTLRTGAVYAG